MKYLFDINSPLDVKKIPQDQLPVLCDEIRELIIKVVSNRGGHLASSLGAVEIATALHYIFDAPNDKIVWDVGHQAYAHKILTGRRERFCSLRSYKGISGFPNQNESEYDTFIVGHANTAISAGWGMLSALRHQNKNNKVISVIGDATLTGGMAYEALNNAGHSKKNFLVILNDNEMAISKNVGGMSNYLNKIITMPIYNKFKKDMEHFIEKIPAIGPNVVKTSHKLEESIKSLIVPGAIFEELGFRYFGPVDGNDIHEVIKILRSIKDNEEPMILHLITKKGKGYKPAENGPESYHGAAPFEVESGSPLKKDSSVRFTDAFGDILNQMAAENPNIVAITAAMCSGTGLTKFAKSFPDRFYDVGIAEQHAITFAGGMAKEGMRPIVAIYSTFLQRGYDQVVHDVCLQNVPVCLILDRAGLVGEDGPTHHGVFDISFLRCIPNIVIAQPKDGSDLKGLMKTAISHNGPFAIRFPRNKVLADFSLDNQVEVIPIGKSEVLLNGDDAVIIALGNHTYIAKEICDELRKEDFSVGLVNGRFVKPLDVELIKSLAEAKKPIVTIEDNALAGGFGSAVIELLNSLGFYNLPVLRLGIKDDFITHGDLNTIHGLCGLDKDGIKNSVLSFLRSVSTRPFLTASKH